MMRKRHVGGHECIVDELGLLPRANRTQMNDELAEAFEHRSCSREGGGVTADHDGECASLCSRLAAANGCIQQLNATCGGLLGKLYAGVRMYGRMNGDPTSIAHDRDQGGADVSHADIVDHAYPDMIGMGTQLGEARRGACPGIGERCKACRTTCPERDIESGIYHPARHGRAL